VFYGGENVDEQLDNSEVQGESDIQGDIDNVGKAAMEVLVYIQDHNVAVLFEELWAGDPEECDFPDVYAAGGVVGGDFDGDECAYDTDCEGFERVWRGCESAGESGVDCVFGGGDWVDDLCGEVYVWYCAGY